MHVNKYNVLLSWAKSHLCFHIHIRKNPIHRETDRDKGIKTWERHRHVYRQSQEVLMSTWERVNDTPLRNVGCAQVSASALPQGQRQSDAYETKQRRINLVRRHRGRCCRVESLSVSPDRPPSRFVRRIGAGRDLAVCVLLPALEKPPWLVWLRCARLQNVIITRKCVAAWLRWYHAARSCPVIMRLIWSAGAWGLPVKVVLVLTVPASRRATTFQLFIKHRHKNRNINVNVLYFSHTVFRPQIF